MARSCDRLVMHAQRLFALGALYAMGCGTPLAAIPLQAASRGPQVLAAPMEDGSVYVLAEGGPMTSAVTLRQLWRKKAAHACEGDYILLSSNGAQSQGGGVVRMRSHEGFVRCVSPEGLRVDAGVPP